MFAIVLRRCASPAALFVGATLLAAPSCAGDRPATAEGAQNLQAFFDRFLPAPPKGAPPLVTVKPDGQHYLASADLAALNDLFKSGGANVAYDSATLSLELFEQDDGKWRVVQDAVPTIVSHANDATGVTKIDNYHQTTVIDPALAWFVSCAASADKGSVGVSGPKLNQTFDFGPLKADCATTVNADGSVSSTAKEDIRDIAFKVSATDQEGKPVGFSGRIGDTAFNIGVDGLKSRKLFDLVALISAHRDDLAAHEGEVKDALRPLAAPGLRFVEGGQASRLMFGSQMGAVALDGAKFAIGVANAGPDSAIDTTISADGLSLPVGLVPPNATGLTPSKIDLGLTVKGIDLAAAAGQAIDSLHLGGPGPAISEAEFGQGVGGFARGRSAQDRDRPLACGRAGARRGHPGRSALRCRQAIGRRDDPNAQLRQDDERDPGAGAGGGGQGAARGRHGEGARQVRTRRRDQLARRSRPGPFDQGQRHSARQGAGVGRESEGIAVILTYTACI